VIDSGMKCLRDCNQDLTRYVEEKAWRNDGKNLLPGLEMH
jgi:hypothetical protein